LGSIRESKAIKQDKKKQERIADTEIEPRIPANLAVEPKPKPEPETKDRR
jgi:hypothetical protein